MIRLETGDIFESSAQCLVNTVNCQGFMGKGIAYQFKQRFPENNKYYENACKNGTLKIGKILLFQENKKIIANFPTKDKWREPSKYSYIQDGLSCLHSNIIHENIQSVAIPPLGCGNGGLDWNVVKEMITDALGDLNTNIIIYEPSANFTKIEKLKPHKMTASHLILMKLKGGLTMFNKLRIQKAAYMLNVFSGTDYFKFEEHKFGPYAHSIEILSEQIKAFQKSYNVNTSGAEMILYNNIISDSVKETVEKYKISILKSTSFVNSISSNHELEVVTTVIAIIRLYPDYNDEEIADYFLNNWPKYNKDRFTKSEIFDSIQNLQKSGIIAKKLIGYFILDNLIDNAIMPKYKTAL